MLKTITLVAAAAAAQNATINLFTAVDKPAYLAELAASMRHIGKHTLPNNSHALVGVGGSRPLRGPRDNN